ncbi:MAG TPA: efflux RND transporter periplasmic adaptor subunit, partial [Clostridia bacterium]|nr:efflux RND transporter periplasmic adaptor subunit [Clostridia bacterium]
TKQRPTTEEVAGTIRPKLHSTIEARLSARIDKLPVHLGQSVKAGQLLAHLDAPEIKARLEQAKATLLQTESDWKRISSLFDQQAATRSDADNALSRFHVARAAVAEAQTMMEYLEIRAPFDCVITKKWVDVGDLASPGKPLISIEDPAMLQVEADIPEALASRIQQNDRLSIRVNSLNHEVTGTISEIAPAADPATRTLRVKLDLPQIPALKSGQFARVIVPVGASSAVRVPVSAVLHRGQLEILFVVTNQHARLHLVTTGQTVGDEVEILSGLDPGATVVVAGAALLIDGQPLQTR